MCSLSSGIDYSILFPVQLRKAAEDAAEKFQDQQMDAMIESERKHQEALDLLKGAALQAKKKYTLLEQQLASGSHLDLSRIPCVLWCVV